MPKATSKQASPKGSERDFRVWCDMMLLFVFRSFLWDEFIRSISEQTWHIEPVLLVVLPVFQYISMQDSAGWSSKNHLFLTLPRLSRTWNRMTPRSTKRWPTFRHVPACFNGCHLAMTLTLTPGGPVQGLPEGSGQIPGGQSPEGHRSRPEGESVTVPVELFEWRLTGMACG